MAPKVKAVQNSPASSKVGQATAPKASSSEQVVGDLGVFTPLNDMDYCIPEGEYQKLQKRFSRILVKEDMNPDRLSYEEFLLSCPAANEFLVNFKRMYARGQLHDAGQGRIVDPSTSRPHSQALLPPPLQPPLFTGATHRGASK